MRLLHGVAYKSRPLFHIHLQTFGKRLLCLTANTHTHLNTHSRHQKRTYSTNTNIQLKHFWAPATHTWKGDDNGDRATSATHIKREMKTRRAMWRRRRPFRGGCGLYSLFEYVLEPSARAFSIYILRSARQIIVSRIIYAQKTHRGPTNMLPATEQKK